jgi:chorismate mutase
VSADTPPATAVVVPVGGVRGARPALNGSMAELRNRRYELAERVAELTWDLGGLTYEMAVRDHYRLDVLARRAAELQEADAQLGEVQRLLASAEAGVHGQCRSCGAVHSRGAAFCWHCGAGLIQEARPSVLESSGESG